MQLTTGNARLKDFASLNGAELLPPNLKNYWMLSLVKLVYEIIYLDAFIIKEKLAH